MDFSILEKRLRVTFNDRGLLKRALTHKSYLNENRNWPLGHNERLEFLGDAVLELVVTDFLFRKYPDKQEGLLTAYRAGLVNTMRLADVAIELGFNDFLLISKGEAKNNDRSRRMILGSAFEAVVGALRLDQGYEIAQQFVARFLLPKMNEIVAKELWYDPKSRLQEVAQKELRLTPTYQVLEQRGPDHDKQFIVGVYFGSNLIAKGQGEAKRLAEAKAAEAALALKEQHISVSST